MKIIKGIVVVLVIILVLATGYSYFVAPWVLTRGATDAELTTVLPGDKYVPNPKLRMTQAITIDVPPQKVWPWLVQMGQDRAGFYSYERLERLCGFGIHNTYEINPAWQNLKAGDFVKFHQNGIGMWVVAVEKDKNIVMLTDSRKSMKEEPGKKEINIPLPAGMYSVWNWDFNLIALPDGKTRLVARALADWSEMNPVASWILTFGVGTPSSIMQTQMLKEIKQCAEGNHPELKKSVALYFDPSKVMP